MLHFLFEKGFACEDIPKGVSVPVLKVLLEKFEFDLEFVHTRSACDMRVLPPSCDHLMEISMCEPKFLKPK